MTGIVFFSAVLFLIVIGYYYSLSRKHYIAKSLYQFRQSKHQVIMYLGEHIETLDSKQYLELKKLLSFIDGTIDHFTNLKSLRLSFKVVVYNTIESDEKIDSSRGEHEIIEPFLKEYHQGVMYSLKAIPLLKIRIFISLLQFIFTVLISIGLNKFKDELANLDSFQKAEDNYNNQCFN